MPKISCGYINECMLLLDNCLVGQRCVNTPGSFKCVRTLPCGTGYVLNSDTGQCIGASAVQEYLQLIDSLMP
ncbi:unnamed protein product [Gongylonema pulchrum]|uniref:EGF_CA domain-containing protein n=1 Tax=Gongylonema pulchrum TaxID=637853 RepID=A0A183DU84_9BILA|nr:unnamed protein product [Gongylonema pulchrum]